MDVPTFKTRNCIQKSNIPIIAHFIYRIEQVGRGQNDFKEFPFLLFFIQYELWQILNKANL